MKGKSLAGKLLFPAKLSKLQNGQNQSLCSRRGACLFFVVLKT